MVNFKIVENYSHEHKFEDFSRDYKDGMTKPELLKKYQISRRIWHEWKERLPPRKHYTRDRPKKIKIRKKYESLIKLTPNGNYTVYRRQRGAYRSYGTYPSRNIAVMVQELLTDANWDSELAYNLIDRYAIRVSKNCLLHRIKERDK